MHRGADGLRAVAQYAQFHRAGQGCAQRGQARVDAFDHVDDVRARLTHHIDHDGRLPVCPRAQTGVFRAFADLRHVAQPQRLPVFHAQDELAVFLRRSKLVVAVDGRRARRAVKAAFGRTHVGLCNARTHVGQRKPMRGERLRVGLHAHRRTLAAGNRHQPDAGNLRQLLRQARVGKVMQTGQRQFMGGERQTDDRRICRVHLVVDRRGGQIRRQQAVCRVDGRLHALLGGFQRQIQTELQGNHRRAAAAVGSHLQQPRHLSKLPFQRRGDSRQHHVGAGAGVMREDADGRVIDLRQRRHRQHPVRA